MKPELLLSLSSIVYNYSVSSLGSVVASCFCLNSISLYSMVTVVQMKFSFASQVLMAAFYLVLKWLLYSLPSPSALIAMDSLALQCIHSV